MGNGIKIAKYEITKTSVQVSVTKTLVSLTDAQTYLKDMKERAVKRNLKLSKNTKNKLLIDLRQSSNKMWLFTIVKQVSTPINPKIVRDIQENYFN